MRIAAILAIASGGDQTSETLKLAGEVAKAFDASLDILHVKLDPRMAVPMVGEGMAAGMVQDIMERNEKESAERAARAKETAEELATSLGQSLHLGGAGRGPGLSVAYREVVGAEPEELRKEAPYHDLLVMDRPDLENDAYSTISAEAALMETGRPVLLCPPGGISEMLKHVAIGWDGTKTSTHAVAAALPLLEMAEKVSVLTIDEPKKTADPERLVAYLGRHGVSAQAEHIPAEGLDPGYALLENAATRGAHMLVMGGYGHSRLREFIFGGATENVLRSTGIPVLMAH
jgi:nucleotide-binding universal stress UspA family protein